MIRLFHDTHYDFIRWWKWAAGITIAFIVIIVICLAVYSAVHTPEPTQITKEQK